MVKQIRDYVLEARLIRESKEQKNEDTKTKTRFLRWSKLPQVKAAIAKADEKAFLALMEDFDNSEDFPPVQVKNGKLVFALTEDLITIDSIANEWFNDNTLFESSQKNEADYTKDWELYRNGAKGSFMQHLAQAFQQADMKNAKKLYDAFPEVGKLFMLWKTNGQKDRI